MRGIFLCLFFICCVSSVSFAGIFPAVIDWEVGGQWSSYGYVEAVQKDKADDEFVTDSRVLLENDIAWEAQNISANLDVEWRFDTFKGMENESQGELRFRDAYVQWRQEQNQLSLGQKSVTWGKLDDLVVLDRVSPQDYTHFILYDKQERKDPAPMLQYLWFGEDDLQVETIFMPVFQPSELDFFGTNWAVFGHLKEVVSESSDYTVAQKNIVSGISIQDDDDVTDNSLKNSQIAMRVRGRKDEVDYGVYYMNLYHSIPVLKETNPTGNITKRFLYDPSAANLNALVTAGASGNDLLLTEAHPRINTFGADWETVFGAFGLRGEMALFLGMPYLAEDFSYTETDQVSMGLGIDHTTESQWYIDLQYLQDYILNYNGLYGTEEAPYQFAGTVSKGFMRGRVVTDFDWVWNASYGDWMVNPEMTYKWERPGIDISIGSLVFQEGTSSSLFGRYDHNDVVYIKFSGKF